LYNTEWKVVTYINLETADDNFINVTNYAQCPLTFEKSILG
jgi:hypothetical protein